MVAQSYSHDPTILLVMLTAGPIIGAFVTGEWKLDDLVFGSEEMFLFKFSGASSLETYPARPEYNRQYIKVNEKEIQIGQGKAGVALYLDEELNNGFSKESATYGNPVLSDTENFQVRTVELWGFV